MGSSWVFCVRREISEEVDGPVLRHGLEGQRNLVPSRRLVMLLGLS